MVNGGQSAAVTSLGINESVSTMVIRGSPAGSGIDVGGGCENIETVDSSPAFAVEHSRNVKVGHKLYIRKWDKKNMPAHFARKMWQNYRGI